MVFLIIFYAVSCDREQEERSQSDEEIPEQILQQFSTKHSESGVTKWTLIADSGQFMETVVYVQNPTIQFFEDGQVSITVTGDRGEIIQSNNNIKVFENVVGTSQNGVLYTNELHWQKPEWQIVCTARVRDCARRFYYDWPRDGKPSVS